MNIRCWEELVQYGALEVLQREYGSLLSNQTEPDYNVSLQIDLEQVPTDQGQRGCDTFRLINNEEYQNPGRLLFNHLPCLNAMLLQPLLNAPSMLRRN